MPYKTTKGIVERTYTEEGILIHNLPATIRDAIYVTRKLGLRYLWVDAFCILQGDKDDWEAESAQMCNVYANSYITICAARATSCSDGFLHPRNKSWLDLRFQSTINPTVSGHYSILLDGRGRMAIDNDIKKTKWQKRAWVWQEETLSPRLLIFGQRLIQFRCDTRCTLEYGYSEELYNSRLGYEADYTEFWRLALKRYPPRQLTVNQDRLSAIAGVVKTIQRRSETLGKATKYIAGIWLDDNVATWLLWNRRPSKLSRSGMMEMFTDPATYIAPSWSWASRNTYVGSLTRNESDEEVVFKINSYDIRPAHSDATVAVKFGSSLTLQGRCLRTRTNLLDAPFRGLRGHAAFLWEICEDGNTINFWLDWDPNADDRSFTSEAELFLLTIYLDWWKPTKEQQFSKMYAGLVLLPFQGPQGKAYHRVGVFELHGNRDLFESVQDCTVVIF